MAGLTLLMATAASAAPVPKAGEKGDPQPEMAPFDIAASGATGTGAVLANGDIVLATPSKSGETIGVCMMHPGDRKCASTATLRPHHNDSFYGPAEVVATGGSNVAVVADDCCYIGNNGVVVFDSTNNGSSWGAETEAGDAYGVGGATLAGGKVVIVVADPHSGTEVQAFAPKPSTPSSEIATVASGTGDTAITTYKNGVLVASDNTTNTSVEYAPSGSDFGSKASYTKVGSFSNQTVIAVSGNALLTDVGGSITGNVRIQFFNGTKFGAAYKVPQPTNYDDGYFGLQEVGSRAYVFYLDRREGYAVFQVSTSDGTHWSGILHYPTAETQSSDLQPVLGPTGAGLLFATDGSPMRAQPVLNTQSAHATLTKTVVKTGQLTTLTATASPHEHGTVVVLQHLSGGLWNDTGTTEKESSSGTVTFSVSAGTWRVVVTNIPGYYQYGYSNSVTVTTAT